MNDRAPWNDDQDTEARKLWLRGIAARTIGRRVGKTRMAVIGRADREGWGPHPKAALKPSKWLSRAARPTLTLVDGDAR